MKRYYFLLLLFIPPISWCIPCHEDVVVEEYTHTLPFEYDTIPVPTDWDRFTEAVIWKESRGNESAVGDNGKAVGVLQMWPIMVREASRISGVEYSLEDRLSRDKSIEMWNVIQDYHNPSHDFKKALRIWNRNHPKSYYEDILSYYNLH